MLRHLFFCLAMIAGQASAQTAMLDSSARDFTATDYDALPKVVAADSDLSFWTNLASRDACTPVVLAQSVANDAAREGCTANDEQCHRHAGSVVSFVCLDGTRIFATCEHFHGEVGTAEFGDCLRREINLHDGRPTMISETETPDFVPKTLAQIKDGLPRADDIVQRTGLPLPERRRAMDAHAVLSAEYEHPCPTTQADALTICDIYAPVDALHKAMQAASLLHGLMR